MSDTQKQLQALSDAYTDLQNGTSPLSSLQLTLPPTNSPSLTDLTTLITRRRTLSSQLTESTSVLTTITPLKDSSQIYKLIGPVLLKQSKPEATMSVDARVKFIEGRIIEVEGKIAETQEKMESMKGDIIGLQSRMEGGGGQGGQQQQGVKA